MTENDEIDCWDRTIPCSSKIIILFGFIILVSGIVLIYIPPLQSLSAGIGVFALGLAVISFGFTQRSNFNSRITTLALKEQLKRIEEKLDKKLSILFA
jgi:hypothetical protein